MRRVAAIILALGLAQVPAFAESARVMCRNGTWVRDARACRHRGGVVAPHVYRRSARRPPLARCRDGSVQSASRRTCKRRGGVAYWM